MSINIDRVSELENYVAWDLEREHGDIGLGSHNDKERLPPLSALGASFWKAESSDTARDLVGMITANAHGSIVLAKLGLDVVHSATSVDDIELSRSHLPKNVQALFDEGIQQIMQQPAPQRELALKSIAAVVKLGPMEVGTHLSTLAAVLRERAGQNPVPPRSTEDILQSTKGYLRLEPPFWGFGPEYCIVAYNFLFYTYVTNSYNDELVWANAQLRTTNIRSFTQFVPKKDEALPERPMQSILGDLRKFHSESPPVTHVPRPPLSRHEPLLLRSSTELSAGSSRGRAKPDGLGLRF
jgi:hypothetical protein